VWSIETHEKLSLSTTMDALRTAKAALDDGLISQADYEQVKQAFLSSMRAGVGGGGGGGGGSGDLSAGVEGVRGALGGAALDGGEDPGAGAPAPAGPAKRTGSFGALFGGGRKATGE